MIVLELNEIKQQQSLLAATKASKYNPEDIHINFFGGMEIIGPKGTLTGEDIKADQCYLLLAYLILNHKKNFSIDTLAEIICPYRVDYLKIYPCLKERPDVLEVLKKSDRKMKYMEVDLKSEQRRKNAENGAESYIPSKEDSLERLVYSAKCQFADDAEGVEEVVIRKDDLCRLRAALDQLSEEEKSLIRALFFDERSERELEEMMGVHRMTIHNRKIRILQKLKKMLR